MIIAFEGMDGCGKSTIAKRFSEKNGFIHEPQRIMSICNIKDKDFDNFVKILHNSDNKKLGLLFYTFRCMLDNETKNDTVIERTMMSTYYFEKDNIDSTYWDFSMKLDVIPNITFLLYASPEERKKRIYNRNVNDEDLNSNVALYDGYREMIEFAKTYDIPYVGINTEKLNLDQIVEICSEIKNNYLNLESKADKTCFLKKVNEKYGIDDLYKDKIYNLKRC